MGLQTAIILAAWVSVVAAAYFATYMLYKHTSFGQAWGGDDDEDRDGLLTSDEHSVMGDIV